MSGERKVIVAGVVVAGLSMASFIATLLVCSPATPGLFALLASLSGVLALVAIGCGWHGVMSTAAADRPDHALAQVAWIAGLLCALSIAGLAIHLFSPVAVIADGRLQLGRVIEWLINQLKAAIAEQTRYIARGTQHGIEWLGQLVLRFPIALAVILSSTMLWRLLPRRWFWTRLGAVTAVLALGVAMPAFMPAAAREGEVVTGIVLVVIGLFTFEAFWLTRRWGITLFTAAGLLLLWNMGLWIEAIQTFVLVILATLVTIVLGVPLGILAAVWRVVYALITPILDFMQTLPAFVYLIPAIAFFSLGETAALVATVIFAMPPAIRLTTLGIQQVPDDLVEAADAFGSTRVQKLLKLELPTAMPSIQAGINQAIMLSLSMVVIAAMIGAPGLGDTVWTAIQRLNTGMGFEGGIGIVILAMILDRTLRGAGRKTPTDTA
jgi:glycine betaine/proline transport system permease protein